MKILVDTSVWIYSFMGKPPFQAELQRLLSMDQVAGHELIYGELLMGDIGGRPSILADYAKRGYLQTIPHNEVVELVRAKKLHGRGVGWVDIHLLASAMVAKTPLWTADPRLATLVRECGIAYDVSK